MRLQPTAAAVTIVLSSALAVPRAGAGPDAFALHNEEALRNEKTPAGKAYSPVFGKEFGAGFAPRVTECAKRTGGPRSDPFDLVLKLDGKGRVQDALVHPRTPLSQCFAKETRKATFPAPPSPGYWVAARMRFTGP